MKTIRINHIAKTEGHMSFVGALVDGDFAEARIETEEGIRLIEGVLTGRKYFEAPIITARICGICPIVHNLTSIKALEQALGVEITPEITLLRKLLINAQWVHSHGLHAFFLSFPDIVGISSNFDFIKKYGPESTIALELRDFGVELARIIGGRTVHPINSVVGGFNVEPDFAEMESLMAKHEDILEKTITLARFVMKHELPDFESPTNYVSLKNKKEYAIYDGDVFFFDNKMTLKPAEFWSNIEELIEPFEKVKRVKHLGKVIMLGAISRLNNSHDQLNPEASKLLHGLTPPFFNPFFNLYAQAIELVHSVEEIRKLWQEYIKLKNKKLKVKVTLRAGKGVAVMEAPRGILYHEYELDSSGTIIHANIIPPTTTFLANMEKDLTDFLPLVKDIDRPERDLLIKMLIRAYDPCISCATH